MIKKIILHNCTPYKHAELNDCKKINYIYGANGSGKSTLSGYLAGDKSPRFEECSTNWESTPQETICVYNRGFRNRNFKQTIPGVFTLGSAAIDDINELEELKVELTIKQEDLWKKSEHYRKQIEEIIPAREGKFRDDAWTQILKTNESDFRKAFEGLRNNKEKFVKELKLRIAEPPMGNVCPRENLITRANTLYAGKSERCNRFSLDIEEWISKIESVRTDPIWKTVIAGNEDVDIAALIKELGNSSWVDQGRKYIKTGTMTCPFCQKETITNEFAQKLESFFDTEYQNRVEKMKKLLTIYREATNHINQEISNTLKDEVAVKIGKIDTSSFSVKHSILSAKYLAQQHVMEEKIKEPGKKIIIQDVTPELENIRLLIADANRNIDAHNKLVDERDIEVEILKNDIWATVIHDADILINSYQKDIKNLEKGAKGIKKSRDAKREEVEKLEQLVVEKGKNITSVQPTINEINRSLRAYGFTNFSIQPAEDEENYYCIMRDDGTLATGTLSEGEETFLTFLYFMQWTKGSTDPEHVSDQKIIVLDDPISSLDSTILYIVGAMIKDLSRKIKAGEGDVTQLFVLTHNVFFHKEASFDPRQKMGKDMHFWIIRKDNDISEIKDYEDKNPISTSYELLWSEIRENDKISQISIQNAMRRIIENYYNMLGKEKDEELLLNFESAEEQMIARSLLYWINDGSHSIPDDLFIDSYTDAVPKYRSVFKEIFRASGHLAHYNMMMRIEDEPEPIIDEA